MIKVIPRCSRTLKPGLKRFVHLGLTMLCLLALTMTPVLCGHALLPATHRCDPAMMGPGPMHHHTVPPCCAAHSSDQPAQTGVSAELPTPSRPSILLTAPLLAADQTSGSVASVQDISPFTAFRPPLRI